MNRHDRRRAKAMDRAIPLTQEVADQYGMMIQNMQDAMAVVAALVKKLGGEVTIMAEDLVLQYQISEERVRGGFTLKLNEISRADYHDITGEQDMTH